jgi:hypothetical protein
MNEKKPRGRATALRPGQGRPGYYLGRPAAWYLAAYAGDKNELEKLMAIAAEQACARAPAPGQPIVAEGMDHESCPIWVPDPDLGVCAYCDAPRSAHSDRAVHGPYAGQ